MHLHFSHCCWIHCAIFSMRHLKLNQLKRRILLQDETLKLCKPINHIKAIPMSCLLNNIHDRMDCQLILRYACFSEACSEPHYHLIYLGYCERILSSMLLSKTIAWKWFPELLRKQLRVSIFSRVKWWSMGCLELGYYM